MPHLDPDMQEGAALSAFAAVEAWAEAWYRDEHGRDRLSFDGIPCGDAIRVDVFEFVLEAVNNALGLPARRLGRPALRPLRARGLDREVRSWGLRTASMGRRQSGGRSPVAFISEGATPSALESSMAVAAELTAEQATVGVSDPRSYRAWRSEGWDPIPLVLGAREDRRVARRSAMRSLEAWREARMACLPLIIDGQDLTQIALHVMDHFVPRSVARLTADWTALTRFLGAVDPRVVALASDQHRSGRLAAEIARREGRRSIVLQHGLPQSLTGYLPVHADVFLAWSEASAAWFVERGTAPRQLRVVGNPRFDRLATLLSRERGDARPTRSNDKTDRRVLLALSVAPLALNSRLVAITLDAVQSLPGTALIIKLHPGGSDWGFVRRLVRDRAVTGGAISILDREDLYPLLAWSDIVVVHRSSVAAEALAARRPVIAVAADGTSVASMELLALGLPEVADAPHLANLIVEHTGDEAGAAFFAEREASIVTAVGPIDGLTARRAADAILRLASGDGQEQASPRGAT